MVGWLAGGGEHAACGGEPGCGGVRGGRARGVGVRGWAHRERNAAAVFSLLCFWRTYFPPDTQHMAVPVHVRDTLVSAAIDSGTHYSYYLESC